MLEKSVLNVIAFLIQNIAEEKMVELVTECEQISKRIANFISYLNKKDFKGNKFK